MFVLSNSNYLSNSPFQYTEEGYDVVHITYPSDSESLEYALRVSETALAIDASGRTSTSPTDFAVLTFGLSPEDVDSFINHYKKLAALPKAFVHYCPQLDDGRLLLIQSPDGTYVS